MILKEVIDMTSCLIAVRQHSERGGDCRQCIVNEFRS